MTGRLAGIARHGRKFGPVETLPAVRVSLIDGVAGDYASSIATHKPSRKRQVSLIELDCWNAALAEVGAVLLPAPVSGSPMTYSVNGKQYIVVAVSGGNYSGEYIALRLPDGGSR